MQVWFVLFSFLMPFPVQPDAVADLMPGLTAQTPVPPSMMSLPQTLPPEADQIRYRGIERLLEKFDAEAAAGQNL
jgi:hypothetical protein